MSEPITKEAIDAYKRQQLETFQKRMVALCDEFSVEVIAVPAFTNDGRVEAHLVVQVK